MKIHLENDKFNEKTSPKGFAAFKCDVGNRNTHMCDIFKILGILLEIVLGTLLEFLCNFLGILLEYFGNSFEIL